MKRLMAVLLILTLSSGLAYAQTETLLSGKLDHGGYGGVSAIFSQVNGEFGAMIGGYGAWLINHRLALGGGAYGLVNNIKFDETIRGRNRYLSFEYGGFLIEYLHNPNKLVHLNVQALIGGGEVNLRYSNSGDDYFEDEDDLLDDDYVFVLSPKVNLELNVTHYMRIRAGAGYRYVSGVNVPGLGNDDFSSPTANISVMFGAF